MSKNLEKTISQLMDKHFIIPMYQRNYAWGEDEISLLLDDIFTAWKRNSEKYYYIGSLVVFAKDDKFEVIDGQQRLTTLSLILLALRSKGRIKLKFEHRKSSNETLEKLENEKLHFGYNSLANGFLIISDKLKVFEKEENYEQFIDYFLNKVLILETEVPRDTDLNHYFEIMNNRGVQLEKHEVLKAKLMNLLSNDPISQNTFSKIWEACSDMSGYAILNFSKEIRPNYYDKLPYSFDEMRNYFSSKTDLGKISIQEILKGDALNDEVIKDDDEIAIEKYQPIIDFPNFLLHVLRIYEDVDSYTLNDKELLNEFEKAKLDSEEDAKRFCITLLRVRLLFDRYIIKSNEDERWVLERINQKEKSYNTVNTFELEYDNLIKLLSMFHCTFKSRVYKEWLYNILEKLNSLKDIKENHFFENQEEYVAILEKQAAETYMKLELKANDLNQGTSVPHYVFNYLDYLIWKDQRIEINSDILNRNKFNFSMSSNSIEHYWSQKNRKELEQDGVNVDNFGNLCLISRHQNSALSDDPVSSKKEHYKSGRLQCGSLKQAAMFAFDEWNADSILEHRKQMLNLLNESLSILQK